MKTNNNPYYVETMTEPTYRVPTDKFPPLPVEGQNKNGSFGQSPIRCPLCNHRNNFDTVPIRRRNEPNTHIKSAKAEDVQWQCENCQGWISPEDEE